MPSSKPWDHAAHASRAYLPQRPSRRRRGIAGLADGRASSQYGSGTCRELLRAAGMRQSMSPRAPIPIPTPGLSPSSAPSKPKCSRMALSSGTPMLVSNSSLTSNPTTIPTANTPPSDTKPRHFRGPSQLQPLNKCRSRNPLHLVFHVPPRVKFWEKLRFAEV